MKQNTETSKLVYTVWFNKLEQDECFDLLKRIKSYSRVKYAVEIEGKKNTFYRYFDSNLKYKFALPFLMDGVVLIKDFGDYRQLDESCLDLASSWLHSNHEYENGDVYRYSTTVFVKCFGDEKDYELEVFGNEPYTQYESKRVKELFALEQIESITVHRSESHSDPRHGDDYEITINYVRNVPKILMEKADLIRRT